MVILQIGTPGQHEANLQDSTQLPLKQQRRLSKPNASGKSIVSSSIGPTFTIRRKAVPKNNLSSPYSQGASLHNASRSSLLGLPAERAGDDTPSKPSVVALLVNKIESATPAASTSQLSLSTFANTRSSTLTTDKPSMIYKASVSTLASRERLGVTSDLCSISPSSSQDRLGENPAPPPRRTASFTPGIATRKASNVQSTIQEISEKESISSYDDAPVSQVEQMHNSDCVWNPPPQISRSETPLDLDYTHLGGLTLGSLHIVNGRASPAFSEMSRHLKSQLEPRVRRDISSIYPDSDKDQWEDVNVPSSPTSNHASMVETPKLENRQFSFAVGSEAHLSTIAKDDTASTTASSRQDKTSQMAEEYMAELPVSPYQGSPASSSGSVKRHKHKSNSARSFVDETSTALGDRPETAASYYSARPSTLQDERFSSAVEIQPAISPSPESEKTLSIVSERRPRLSDRSSTAKSDSGYSSNTSSSVHVIGGSKLGESSQDQGETTPKASVKSNFMLSVTKGRPNHAKGILINPPPVKPLVGLVEGFGPSASSSRALPTTPSLFRLYNKEPPTQMLPPEKPGKTRKKLQKFKRKPMVQSPKEIVVQKKTSMTSLHGLPDIDAATRSNLARRVEAIPELEETFKTHQHTKHQASTSVLQLPLIEDTHPEIRFPSPAPENKSKRSRSWSRPRMPNRPKSWFGWTKDEKKEHKKQQSTHEFEDAKAILNSFGTVIDALGTNPYDIATSRNSFQSRADLSRRNTSPYAISFNSNRPKSMMDDDTAVKISRMRSKFAAEKDARYIQRHSFDDRGGIPGRYPLPTSVTEDAPPMPPIPNQEELERRFSHHISRPASISLRADQWDPRDLQDHDHQSSPAPPPPPHSPRPQFVDQDQSQQQEVDAPPPPPCHSPRPRDISPYSFAGTGYDVSHGTAATDDEMWAAQSRAWRARRVSAGEVLRQSWEIEDSLRSYEQDPNTVKEESLYPEIPHRINSWREPTRYYDDGYDYGFQEPRHQSHQQPGNLGHSRSNMAVRPVSTKSYWSHEFSTYHAMHDGYDRAHYNHNPHWQQWHHQQDWEQSYDSRSRSRPHSRGRQVSNQSTQSRLPSQRYYEHIPPSRIDSRSRHSRSPHSQRITSRPHSRANSSHSMAVSLAEELHPDIPARHSPAPDFGRYSGGLEFGYEGRARGFGGSAGTRSVSGKADAQRKSVADGLTYGVDFSDIPAMTVSVGAAPGGKMRYGAWYDGEGRRHDG